MIALDVAGALIAVCAIMAARLDLDEADMPGDTDALDSRHSAEKACDARASDSGLAPGEFAADASDGANRSCGAFSGILATVRAILVEVDEGFKVLKGFRGLFALLWCGFAFTLVFALILALFPIMVLDHFGGNTGDAALAEIVFAVGMIAGGALLATTGGFKNRAFTVVAATALYGMATIFCWPSGRRRHCRVFRRSVRHGILLAVLFRPPDGAHAREGAVRVLGACVWAVWQPHGVGFAPGVGGIVVVRRRGRCPSVVCGGRRRDGRACGYHLGNSCHSSD